MKINNFYTYQRKKVRKYGKLPAKVDEEIPWDKLLVYLMDHMDV